MAALHTTCRSEICKKKSVDVDVAKTKVFFSEQFTEDTQEVDDSDREQVERLGTVGLLLFTCSDDHCASVNVRPMDLRLTLLTVAAEPGDLIPLPDYVFRSMVESVELNAEFADVLFGED